jgi:hypothetical protein
MVMLAVFAVAGIAQPAAAPSAVRAGKVGAARLTPEQRLDQLATRAGLADQEKAAVQAALRDKMAAAQALREQMKALIQLARNKQATDEQLSAALSKYDAALAAYRERIKRIDAELVARLSLRARVAMTVAGVLDNGLRAAYAGSPRAATRAPGAGRGARRRAGAAATAPAAQPAK